MSKSTTKMFKSSHICMLDPSISTLNIGDEIIVSSAKKLLFDLFPSHQIISIPSQDIIGDFSRRLLRTSSLNIVAGTNLLSADLFHYRQLRWNFIDYLRNYNLVLFGVGWWQYQKRTTRFSKVLYRSLLSSSIFHSVRDSYTEKMLSSAGFSNCLNTSCLTMWDLPVPRFNEPHQSSYKYCVVTLTDYNRDRTNDLIIINKL